MLKRTPLFVLGLALSVGSVACITSVDDGSGGSGGSGGSSTTSQGGSGGEGGEGGATNGVGGGGGEGGGETCVSHDGVGVLPAVCDTDIVGQLKCGTGEDEAPAPAILICQRSFELFTEGARENFIACLAEIPATPADVCDEEESALDIAVCTNKMYDEACLNEATYLAGDTGVCAEVQAACLDDNDNGFVVADCLADLNVFSVDGVNAYGDCVNDHPEIACDEIHEFCFDEVFAY